MIRRFMFGFISVLLLHGNVHAQEGADVQIDVRTFLEICDNSDEGARIVCDAYFSAFATGIEAMKKHIVREYEATHGTDYVERKIKDDVGICWPDDITSDQVSEVAMRYVKSKPEILQDSAGDAFVIAWKTAFPCL